jgi:hypothetical protein
MTSIEEQNELIRELVIGIKQVLDGKVKKF